MDLTSDPDWAAPFILSSRALSAHEKNELLRRTRRGELARVIPGVYLPTETAVARTPRQQHRDVIFAQALVSSTRVFSHASAAAMWRLPRVGSWPPVAQVIEDVAPGGRSTPGLARHGLGIPQDIDRIDGILVTTLVRTVVDLARTESFENAVVAAVAALAGRRFGGVLVRASRRELRWEVARTSGRGVAAARAAVDFADGASGSPGETLSRLTIARDGLAAPVLQQKFTDGSGSMYADFFWPELGLIGEFDGVGKYLREEWMDGRTPAQVVIDEKWREDRIRRLGFQVVRWGWNLMRQPGALARTLRAAGLQ